MKFSSTRNNKLSVSSAEAIVRGLSDDGGLFVPETIPEISLEELFRGEKTYRDYAKEIIGLYLTDFDEVALSEAIERAYGDSFPEEVVLLKEFEEGLYSLELWHGPTCAFKDMALQLLPHLLVTASKMLGDDTVKHILVATSGDTGKAALDGFMNVNETKITVFYPKNGVSLIQKRQMQTQEGRNVNVVAIDGNFDDAQSAVKEIFSDRVFAQELLEKNEKLSSANSINFGRLVPQIVYYFYGYSKLLRDGKIAAGEKINIAVPTGNFGNILAAYYAKQMGLPVKKLICASNKNKILADFIETGVYDKNRDFYLTSSPSMDILVSSNLERLLYHLTDEDSSEITAYYDSLRTSGRFKVSDRVRDRIETEFIAGYCDDNKTLQTIKETYRNDGYLLDTHTAVAVGVVKDYRESSRDETKTLIASTANPYKFADSVLCALAPEQVGTDFENLKTLYQLTGLPIPSALADLETKKVRFDEVLSADNLRDAIK